MDRLAPCGARIHLRLPVEPESVAAAHQCVFGVASLIGPSVVADVRLLISELVTNSIRHARLGPDDWIDLHIDIGDETIRVDVRDPGRGFDPDAVPAARRPPEPSAELPRESGWGLLLLRRIASRWGVERDGQTRVWFEMDLGQGAPGTSGPGCATRFAAKGRG